MLQEHNTYNPFFLTDVICIPRGTFDYNKSYGLDQAVGVGVNLASAQGELPSPVRCIISVVDTSGAGEPDLVLVDMTFDTVVASAGGASGVLATRKDDVMKYRRDDIYVLKYELMFWTGAPTKIAEENKVGADAVSGACVIL